MRCLNFEGWLQYDRSGQLKLLLPIPHTLKIAGVGGGTHDILHRLVARFVDSAVERFKTLCQSVLAEWS
eukprot:1240044-Amphidinium_carterae.1